MMALTPPHPQTRIMMSGLVKRRFIKNPGTQRTDGDGATTVTQGLINKKDMN